MLQDLSVYFLLWQTTCLKFRSQSSWSRNPIFFSFFFFLHHQHSCTGCGRDASQWFVQQKELRWLCSWLLLILLLESAALRGLQPHIYWQSFAIIKPFSLWLGHCSHKSSWFPDVCVVMLLTCNCTFFFFALLVCHSPTLLTFYRLFNYLPYSRRILLTPLRQKTSKSRQESTETTSPGCNASNFLLSWSLNACALSLPLKHRINSLFHLPMPPLSRSLIHLISALRLVQSPPPFSAGLFQQPG